MDGNCEDEFKRVIYKEFWRVFYGENYKQFQLHQLKQLFTTKIGSNNSRKLENWRTNFISTCSLNEKRQFREFEYKDHRQKKQNINDFFERIKKTLNPLIWTENWHFAKTKKFVTG